MKLKIKSSKVKVPRKSSPDIIHEASQSDFESTNKNCDRDLPKRVTDKVPPVSRKKEGNKLLHILDLFTVSFIYDFVINVNAETSV